METLIKRPFRGSVRPRLRGPAQLAPALLAIALLGGGCEAFWPGAYLDYVHDSMGLDGSLAGAVELGARAIGMASADGSLYVILEDSIRELDAVTLETVRSYPIAGISGYTSQDGTTWSSIVGTDGSVILFNAGGDLTNRSIIVDRGAGTAVLYSHPTGLYKAVPDQAGGPYPCFEIGDDYVSYHSDETTVTATATAIAPALTMSGISACGSGAPDGGYFSTCTASDGTPPSLSGDALRIAFTHEWVSVADLRAGSGSVPLQSQSLAATVRPYSGFSPPYVQSYPYSFVPGRGGILSLYETHAVFDGAGSFLRQAGTMNSVGSLATPDGFYLLDERNVSTFGGTRFYLLRYIWSTP